MHGIMTRHCSQGWIGRAAYPDQTGFNVVFPFYFIKKLCFIPAAPGFRI